jgi:hypothetical protein
MSPDSEPKRLPRLLVISDVSAERTTGGPLLLYRLLKSYPAGSLLMLSFPTGNWHEPIERVAGAEYLDFRYTLPRAIVNRFNPFWPISLACYMRMRAGHLPERVRAFQPEAVLTISHNYLWFVADAVATRLKIPLHLLLHDDWPTMQTLTQPEWTQPSVRRGCEVLMGRVCRRAQTRLCISPGMAERYAALHRTNFRVLYPSRGSDSPVPMARVRQGPWPRRPVVAFAGAIVQDWTAERLRALAAVLARMGGLLDLYVPHPEKMLAELGLSLPVVRSRGFFPAAEMAERVAASADVLFLPASFEPRERTNMSTLFPSKLADYTAIGLPVLVWGPAYSSAARWGADNPFAVALVTEPEPECVRRAIERLTADSGHAWAVAAAGVAAGRKDFDADGVSARFLDAITTGWQP